MYMDYNAGVFIKSTTRSLCERHLPPQKYIIFFIHLSNGFATNLHGLSKKVSFNSIRARIFDTANDPGRWALNGNNVALQLKLISSIPKNNSAFCMKTSYFMNK